MSALPAVPVQHLVLVVEDDAATRLVLRQALEREGYAVAESANGLQAIETFPIVQPSLVLLDARMPVLDGFETCMLLRQLPGGERTPMLMITGLEDTAHVDQAFAAGITDYVTKPIRWPVLRQRVRRLIAAHQAEAALALSEERFRSLVQHSSDIITILEADGRVRYQSPAVQRITGYAPEELATMVLLDLVHPNDRATVSAAFVRVIQQQSGAFEATFRFRHRNDSWVCLEAIGTNLLANPSVGGVVVNARDISARRRAEEERLALDRKLQETQKLESLGLLAGGVAHDFSNLLQVMLGNVNLALFDLATDHPIRTYLLQIEQAAHQAAELTRQMLVYAGRNQLTVQAIPLNTLIRDMAALLKISIPRSVQLVSQLEEDLPPLAADAAQLRQVVMNLVLNAAEAIGQQQGTITLSTEYQQIDDGYLTSAYLAADLPPGPYVVLRVADTGCGMDGATVAKIFDPFFTTKFTGRGLGLAAVLGIVRGHGGALRVESNLGAGTTFTILLPVEGIAEGVLNGVEQTTSEAQPLPSYPAGSVLVIDGDVGARRTTRQMLESLGFLAYTAADIEHGLALLRQHHVEIICVLFDVATYSGDTPLTETVRQISPDVGIVVMSGYTQQEVQERLGGEPVNLLQKPFNLLDLQAQLRHVV